MWLRFCKTRWLTSRGQCPSGTIDRYTHTFSYIVNMKNTLISFPYLQQPYGSMNSGEHGPLNKAELMGAHRDCSGPLHTCHVCVDWNFGVTFNNVCMCVYESLAFLWDPFPHTELHHQELFIYNLLHLCMLCFVAVTGRSVLL